MGERFLTDDLNSRILVMVVVFTGFCSVNSPTMLDIKLTAVSNQLTKFLNT